MFLIGPNCSSPKLILNHEIKHSLPNPVMLNEQRRKLLYRKRRLNRSWPLFEGIGFNGHLLFPIELSLKLRRVQFALHQSDPQE